LASQVAELITSHGYLERRHNTLEDDGLIGLITLSAAVLRHNPPFKSSSAGQVNITRFLNLC
jgi:ubiquitin carboxyl-terminal hydrolase 34